LKSISLFENRTHMVNVVHKRFERTANSITNGRQSCAYCEADQMKSRPSPEIRIVELGRIFWVVTNLKSIAAMEVFLVLQTKIDKLSSEISSPTVYETTTR
jgi:hypothetical protein